MCSTKSIIIIVIFVINMLIIFYFVLIIIIIYLDCKPSVDLTCNASVSFGRFLMDDCTMEPGRRCTVECIPGYWSVTEEYDVLCMPDGEWEMDMDTFCTG